MRTTPPYVLSSSGTELQMHHEYGLEDLDRISYYLFENILSFEESSYVNHEPLVSETAVLSLGVMSLGIS